LYQPHRLMLLVIIIAYRRAKALPSQLNTTLSGDPGVAPPKAFPG
jgi:hypothetical protein